MFVFFFFVDMMDEDAGQSRGTMPNRKIGMKHPTRKSHEPTPRIKFLFFANVHVKTALRRPIRRTQ